jgi:hypothetical protein
MSDIKLRIILNKGRHGIGLHKLAKIAEQADKFLASFADDMNLSKTEWIADAFKNGCVQYDANYIGSESDSVKNRANKTLEQIIDPKTALASLGYSVSRKTLINFAGLAKHIDQDENIGLAVKNDKGRLIPKKLTKERALRIEKDTKRIEERFGSFYGTINALFREKPSFWLKDATRGRIVCSFERQLFPKICRLIESNEQLVNVEGWFKVENDCIELKVTSVQEIIEYQEGDLEVI